MNNNDTEMDELYKESLSFLRHVKKVFPEVVEKSTILDYVAKVSKAILNEHLKDITNGTDRQSK